MARSGWTGNGNIMTLEEVKRKLPNSDIDDIMILINPDTASLASIESH